jgi:hypothetical protein
MQMDCIKKKSEDVMSAFFDIISWFISVIRTEFDLDPSKTK